MPWAIKGNHSLCGQFGIRQKIADKRKHKLIALGFIAQSVLLWGFRLIPGCEARSTFTRGYREIT
jgi:hypothetical protein